MVMSSGYLQHVNRISWALSYLYRAAAVQRPSRGVYVIITEPGVEQAVLDLLMGMGYGGADGTATRTQLSNDGGIDGVIDQDALGLNRVYVQAKRYALDTAVGRPEIQGFVGALQGRQTNQGVFITTRLFSRGVRDYAEAVATRLIMIDGDRLAALMIRYGVGVQVRQTHHVVELDEDFFL